MQAGMHASYLLLAKVSDCACVELWSSGSGALLLLHCASLVTLSQPLRCLPLRTQRRAGQGLASEVWRLTVVTGLWQAMT